MKYLQFHCIYDSQQESHTPGWANYVFTQIQFRLPAYICKIRGIFQSPKSLNILDFSDTDFSQRFFSDTDFRFYSPEVKVSHSLEALWAMDVRGPLHLGYSIRKAEPIFLLLLPYLFLIRERYTLTARLTEFSSCQPRQP